MWGGVYVHSKHANNADLPRFAGWWGHDEEEIFLMKKGFKPMAGVDGWQLSNANVLTTAALLASLEVIDEAGISIMRKKSLLLTGFLKYLLYITISSNEIQVLTPEKPDERGAQLSILLLGKGLPARQASLPDRQAGVIRVAPVPLYNTYEDVFKFVQILNKGNLY